MAPIPRDLELVAQLLALSPVGTLVVDEDRRVLVHNEAAATSLNVHPQDLANSRFEHPLTSEATDLVLLDSDGTERHFRLESRAVTGLDRAASIVTIAPVGDRVVTRPAIPRIAGSHDALTGLPSRELLLNHLFEVRRRAEHDGLDRPAVIAIDLDRFRRINDWYGRAVGDRVLRSVASRLTVAVRPGDYVSRTGGDEFAVLLAAGSTTDHLEVANRLASVLSQPIEIDGIEHLCAPVIGVAEILPDDDGCASLVEAEAASHRATPGTPRLATDGIGGLQTDRAKALGARLPQAVSEGQLFVNYQPIFSLADRELVGLEALVRWEHPDDGLIDPGQFISIADETGAIVPLGQWVLSEVCEQIASWRSTANGCLVPPVSINLTCRQLSHPELRHDVLYQLALRDLDPSVLRFEITEDALLDRDPHVSELLQQLTDDGFAVDLDEFGTGLSSLTQLQRHPIAGIKISRSFISRMMDDPASAEIVLAGIEVGRALGRRVTATGIERADQHALLERWQCDQAQGYLMARPLNPLQAGRFFRRDPATLSARAPHEAILRSSARSAR